MFQCNISYANLKIKRNKSCNCNIPLAIRIWRQNLINLANVTFHITEKFSETLKWQSVSFIGNFLYSINDILQNNKYFILICAISLRTCFFKNSKTHWRASKQWYTCFLIRVLFHRHQQFMREQEKWGTICIPLHHFVLLTNIEAFICQSDAQMR